MSTSHSEAVRYTDEERALHARNVSFDWAGVPLEYIPGQAYATQFWNVMHLVLPEGEGAMGSVLARTLPLIDDPRLHEEVVGFVGQEATHASSHQGFRDYLRENGVQVDEHVSRITYIVDQIFGDHGLKGRAAKFWLHERLGLYAAAEHYTAVVGEWLLDNKKFDEVGADPTMLDMLRWHGAEEMEHRNVAYDAFQYVSGSYARRVRTAFVAFAGLAILWFTTAADLYREQAAGKRVVPWPIAYYRAGRAGMIPTTWFLAKQIPEYLRPGFHPSQLGPIEKAVRYLAVSPAARAADA